MTEETPRAGPRRPQAFDADDPRVEVVPSIPEIEVPRGEPPAPGEIRFRLPTRAGLDGGWRWGSLLVSAAAALGGLALGIWYTRFVSVALARDDWIGWLATGLFALVVLALAAITLREVIGIFRLQRLGRLRKEAEALIAEPDTRRERDVVRRLVEIAGLRRENAWALRRFRELEADIVDKGALIRLADREVLAPLDIEARRLIYASAKRVATVTAISPMMVVSMGFVAVENVRLLRQLATLYGGRPGLVGGLRLLRMVVSHIIATGGIALTDDLFGQFVGQDILRRISARLGEGAFNASLTARMGAAALEVIRPLPWIEANPVRARDIVKELFRRAPGETGAGDTETGTGRRRGSGRAAD